MEDIKLFCIISLDDTDQVLGYEGKVCLFTTLEGAMDYCDFAATKDNEFGVIEATDTLLDRDCWVVV